MINKWRLIFLVIFLITGCSQQTYDAQGYAEGRFTYIAANFAGVLENLVVARGDQVKINQPLFVLEQQPESDAYKQAVADLALAELTYKRQAALFSKKAVSQDALDTARTNFIKAQAQLAQARWTQAQKTLAAPKAALIFDTYYLPGELVPAGQPVMSLLAPQDIYLVFFVGESQLGALHYGQTVYGYCDSCRNPIAAKITFISPQAEFTPPVIYSNETSAKLVFRIEATPAPADASLLHPGQPVSVNFKQ